jgi:MFS family permease
MLGQMVGSCISGVLENTYQRKSIIVASLLLGSIASILFGIIRYYPMLLMLRVVTGGCQGAIVPVLFSLIGDFYSVDERATFSAIVSSCLGGGMMLGQLFTGYTLGKIHFLRYVTSCPLCTNFFSLLPCLLIDQSACA